MQEFLVRLLVQQDISALGFKEGVIQILHGTVPV
jgi:hypothetical protein